MSHYNRTLLVLTALVAIGLGLAGTSAEVSKRAALSPVTPHSLPTFQIVYFLQGEPHLAVYGSELPQGATFYFEPSQEEQISNELNLKKYIACHAKILHVEMEGPAPW